MQTFTRGPLSASILLVGEAPGERELEQRQPFVGASGQELGRILVEAGLSENEIRFTNVCHTRPPKNKIGEFIGFSKKEASVRANVTFDHGKYFTPEILSGLAALRMEIDAMPNLRLILGVGNLPLWALTGNWGVSNWRGSQLFASRGLQRPIPFVPTWHPAAVLRMWEWRWQSVMDFRRARLWMEENFAVPDYNFIIRPSFSSVIRYLDNHLARLASGNAVRLAADVETRNGHIACLGLADSPRDAICIPFITTNGPYWSVTEECAIIWRLYQLLTQAHVIGQNYNYDRQYMARRWGFRSNCSADTMLKQHICYPGVPKGLDFISSMHCKFHSYWKEESKDWDPKLGEEQLWIYNCKDAVTTFEANTSLDTHVATFKHQDRLNDQMEDNEIALEMMLRGMLVNEERKSRVASELETVMIRLTRFINSCLGIDLPTFNCLDYIDKPKFRYFNPSSPKQVQSLAYDILKLPPVMKKTEDGKRLTADKDAIKEWIEGKADVLYRPLLQAIADFRSLQVFRSTFALAGLDSDGRWRCSINVAGPHTFRWSTGTDAFGFGTNMQNIPKGNEDD